MSTETNEELVKKIKAGEDVAGNMAKLWQQNKNFVYSIARKYGESEIDDLMQEGYLGMYRAVGNYDLSAGTSFAYSAGADVKAVSEILGHASTSVTLDTYAHLTEEKKRQQEEIVKAIKVL